ncbi:MAG: PCP reductase family protein [Gemmatimonadaceae bacterium]
MKFLCLECDAQLTFTERQQPGDGTFAAAFVCPSCGRRIALLANPMETQLVGSLGVRIGGTELDAEPMELTRATAITRDDAFEAAPAVAPSTSHPRWSPDAQARLGQVPRFVRGMVKKIYGDFAAEQGIAEITPDVMDRARTELGLEGM